MRHLRAAAGPQPSRPSSVHLITAYGVRVRNTGRGTWAALIADALAASGMTKVELARRLGVDRATLLRWEQGRNRPDKADVVKRFADLFAMDLEDALAAAGLRPSDEPQRPAAERTPTDPDVLAYERMLADPATPDDVKDQVRAAMRVLVAMAEDRRRELPRRRRPG